MMRRYDRACDKLQKVYKLICEKCEMQLSMKWDKT